MSFLVKEWFGRTGGRYNIYSDDFGNLTCNCPACDYGGCCWERSQEEGKIYMKRMIAAFNPPDIRPDGVVSNMILEAQLYNGRAQFMKKYNAGKLKLVGLHWIEVK